MIKINNIRFTGIKDLHTTLFYIVMSFNNTNKFINRFLIYDRDQYNTVSNYKKWNDEITTLCRIKFEQEKYYKIYKYLASF